MRYGSRMLFEDVTTTFSAGRRYGLTGPNGAGKSTFMKLLTGELDPQQGTVARPRKLGVLRQDQYAFDQHRVIDTVIMGNRRLWDALLERDKLYAEPEMTHEAGMRLGELEGIVGEEDGYSAESDAAILLQGLDIPDDAAPPKDGRAAGRTESARARSRRRCSGIPKRCCSTSPRTISTSTRFTGSKNSSTATTAR